MKISFSTSSTNVGICSALTGRLWQALILTGIFQSALPRGERPQTLLCLPVKQYFNPRSREGSDCQYSVCCGELSNFNPRSREGSDLVGFIFLYILFNFNPRSREGSDWHVLAILRSHARFQSALPRGERRTHPRNTCHQNYFNPRSREGSDNNFHQKVLFSLSKNCLIHLFFITNFLN